MRSLALLAALALVPSLATGQTTEPVAASRVSLVPRVGMVFYGDYYDGPMRYTSPGGSGEGTIEVEPGAQVAVGLAADLRLGRSPWALHAAVDRTSGDFEVNACEGGFCGSGSGDMTAWLLAVGLARDVLLGGGRTAARLRFGGSLARISVEDPSGSDESYDNPGGFLGISFGTRLSPRLSLDVDLADMLVRADTKGVARDISEMLGLDAEVDEGWMNSVQLSVGLRVGL